MENHTNNNHNKIKTSFHSNYNNKNKKNIWSINLIKLHLTNPTFAFYTLYLVCIIDVQKKYIIDSCILKTHNNKKNQKEIIINKLGSTLLFHFFNLEEKEKEMNIFYIDENINSLIDKNELQSILFSKITTFSKKKNRNQNFQIDIEEDGVIQTFSKEFLHQFFHLFDIKKLGNISRVKHLQNYVIETQSQFNKNATIQLNNEKGIQIQKEKEKVIIPELLENPYYILTKTFELNQKIESTLSQESKLAESRFSTIEKEFQEIKDILLKKKKQPKTILPLREPATNKVYYHLINQEKQMYEKEIAYCRFRVAITLLWSTGLRVNEIRLLTKEDIESIIKYKEYQIYQPKVNRYRPLLFTEKTIDQLKYLQKDIEIIYQNEKYLSGNIRKDSWISFINKRLNEKTEGLAQNIKSHSFRINYATSLLRHAPIQKVAGLIGHKDVRTTMMYNRYIPNKSEALQYLEEAIDKSN